MSSRIVVVAGPTGGGKSTLVRALAALSPDLTVVEEPDVHSLHRSSVLTWFDTQLAVVRLREASLHKIRTSLVVMDRHFSEDRMVFFRIHRELGNVTREEYDKLVAETLLIENRVPAPDSAVYVTAPRDILRARMHHEGTAPLACRNA